MSEADDLVAIREKPLGFYQCKYDFGRDRIYLMMPHRRNDLSESDRIEYGLEIEQAEQLAGSIISALIAYQREREFHKDLKQVMDNVLKKEAKP